MRAINVVNVDLPHNHIESIVGSVQTRGVMQGIVHWKIKCKVTIVLQFLVSLVGD